MQTRDDRETSELEKQSEAVRACRVASSVQGIWWRSEGRQSLRDLIGLIWVVAAAVRLLGHEAASGLGSVLLQEAASRRRWQAAHGSMARAGVGPSKARRPRRGNQIELTATLRAYMAEACTCEICFEKKGGPSLQ